jgi:hypothetical protein
MIVKRTYNKPRIHLEALNNRDRSYERGSMKLTAYQNFSFGFFALFLLAVSPNLIAAEPPEVLQKLGVQLDKSTIEDVYRAIESRADRGTKLIDKGGSYDWWRVTEGIGPHDRIVYSSMSKDGTLSRVNIYHRGDRALFQKRIQELSSTYRVSKRITDNYVEFLTTGLQIQLSIIPEKVAMIEDYQSGDWVVSEQPATTTQSPASAGGDPRQACINGCSLSYGICTAGANFGTRPAYERESDLRRCSNNAEVCQANCR